MPGDPAELAQRGARPDEGPEVERFLSSGSEAGTAPGDRRFRPDVEGLRAVAIILVVLFHAGVRGLSGGYVGVDVFFVISGFVITGVLLRERAQTGGTSILAFYGRRCRRIIPAATLVIVATVVLAYVLVGDTGGSEAATDGRWAAIFLANFHFIAAGTNYLTAQQPPSPLQNFWSLAVEEQFYIVYPSVFLILAGLRFRLSLRTRLAAALGVIIAVSFAYSIIQTSTSPTAAYFSPLTRAWELALGALVAVGTQQLLRVPFRLAAVMTWTGLGAILGAAFLFNAHTAYPGSWVAVPVIGAALVIAGGVAAPPSGAETVLGLNPFRYVGRISYSLYLWHWPILILAAESVGKTSLGVGENLLLVLGAGLLSAVTYRFVENPIRHARFVLRRRWASLALGAVLIALTFGVITARVDVSTGDTDASASLGTHGPLSLTALRHLVDAAPTVRSVPADLIPPLSDVDPGDLGFPVNTPCFLANFSRASAPACIFGAPNATRTMVLYGDSHAAMWFQALDDIATKTHWRLVLLSKGDCPADILPYPDPATGAPTGTTWTACAQWQRFAIKRIDELRPQLLIVSQLFHQPLQEAKDLETQWQAGLERFFHQLRTPKTRMVVLGSTPYSKGPGCLQRHTQDVQACSLPNLSRSSISEVADRAAANVVGAQYVNVRPWFCSSTCSEIIGRYAVYWDPWHVTRSYSQLLEGVLGGSLGLYDQEGLTGTR
jgi:peptidoglycan/LPS O-acetylase OafA/YrhL